MNYERIYTKLIGRAKNRKFEGYTEKHHIIPKCMGGTDESENLVDLMPEEHYVAHQLLVKMYPDNVSLIYAANMMCVSSGRIARNNKFYGWLRRKFSLAASEKARQRLGEKNGSFGSFWVTNGVENKRIKGVIPDGWKAGRIFSEESKTSMGRSQIGKKHSEETKNKISTALTGRTLSEETKKKIGLFRRGKSFSKGVKKNYDPNKPRYSVTFCWVNNGLLNKKIDIKLLDAYLENGFSRGRINLKN